MLQKIAIFLCLLLIGQSPIFSNSISKRTLYTITEDRGITLNHRLTISDNSINLFISNILETIDSTMNLNYETQSTTWISDIKGASLITKRNKNIITFTGIHNKKEINKTISIDHHPWFQNMETCFKPFVLSEKKRIIYWALRPKDLKPLKLMATKVKPETIELHNKKYDALKVKIQLTGFMALFWNAHYWFDKNTGEFLQYKGANGPPGTPLTWIYKVN